MRSPFPGMDPYIEACGLWGDFHQDLIGAIKHFNVATRQLQAKERRQFLEGRVADAYRALRNSEETLRQFYAEGLSTKEIARRNGEAVSTVTTRLSRLRARFKDEFRRHIENLGYYFAINDYVDASTWFDWRSRSGGTSTDPGWTRLNGEFRYHWQRKIRTRCRAIGSVEMPASAPAAPHEWTPDRPYRSRRLPHDFAPRCCA